MKQLYDDPELYDTVIWGPCEPFYFELAQQSGGAVLELACGTGRLTVPMWAEGIDIIGLDQSPKMLESAKERAEREKISIPPLILGDMSNFYFPKRFQMIFVAINSLLHLEKHSTLVGCLQCVHDHLAPGGIFAFDIEHFNEDYLSRDRNTRYLVGKYKHHDWITVEETVNHVPKDGIVERTWYFSNGKNRDEHVWKFNMRVLSPQETEDLLQQAGFEIEHRYGDLEKTPFNKKSRSGAYIARRR